MKQSNQKKLKKVIDTLYKIKNNIKKILILSFLIFYFNSFGQKAEENYQKGLKYAEAKEWILADLSYSAAIILNPYNWHYYYNRASARYVLKDFSGALEDIKFSLKLNPGDFTSIEIRANINLELSNYEESIKDYTYLIDNFSEEFIIRYGLLHLERGRCYLYSGNKDMACQDFNEALRRKMSDAQSFINNFCK